PDLAFGRKRAPKAPHRGPLDLLFGRRAHRVRLDVTRIHPFVEEIDGLPLARAIDAPNEDDDRKSARVFESVLRVEQRRAERRHLLIVDLFVDAVTKLRRLEHAVDPPALRPGYHPETYRRAQCRRRSLRACKLHFAVERAPRRSCSRGEITKIVARRI